MSQVCQRCYRITSRACQSAAESDDCAALKRQPVPMTKEEVLQANTVARASIALSRCHINKLKTGSVL